MKGHLFFYFDLGGQMIFFKFIFFNFLLHIDHHGPSQRSFQGDLRHLRQLLFHLISPVWGQGVIAKKLGLEGEGCSALKT